MKYVYHGSNIKDLKVIKPRKSTHGKEYVYASISKTIATIFLSSKGNDLYYYLGNPSIDEPTILVERKEGMFKDIFNVSGSIYTLDSKDFLYNQTSWSMEVVSEKEVIPIKEEYIDNVYDELIRLNELGKIKLYLYPDRPGFIPLDNSDLIPKIMRFEKNEFDVNKFLNLYPELESKYREAKNESINS